MWWLPVFVLCFAFLNRLRGSDVRFGIKGSTAAKAIICAALAYPALRIGIYYALIPPILYLIGESFGWGKWVASIIDEKPQYDENEGLIIIGKLRIWDGIHHIADFIAPEKLDYMNYSMTALCIRGLYWWGPLFLYYAILGLFPFMEIIAYLVILSATFPICFILSRDLLDYLPKIDLLDNAWEWGEFFYGGIQGIAIFFLWSLL